MKLPVEIRPNPLVTTIVEVRYSTDRNINELFPQVISKLINDLPKCEANTKIPPEIKVSDERFKYAADYILSNDNYKFTFSLNAFAFEVVSDYKLWPNYLSFIENTLDKFYGIGHVQTIQRIGLRYASVLNKTTEVLKVLNYVPKLSVSDYTEQFEFYRGKLKAGENDIMLQISNNAIATRPGETISGIYIDIDAFFNGPMNTKDEILKKIEDLHNQEKKLFFSLLKPDFILTLNPRY